MHWQNARTTLLAEFLKQPRMGLITDVDGTLSPIVDRPEAAQVTPRNRELLRELNRYLPLVAAVSGRGVQDVQARVGLPELIYVGNHGLERWVDGRVVAIREAARYRPALEAAKTDLTLKPGMNLEDKNVTLSVHYRNTADPEAIAAEYQPLLQNLAQKHGLKFFQGRMIFELRPPIDINKGTSFESLIQEHRLSGAIFLGDDTTDVDALKKARHLRETGRCYALGIGVESPEMPEAVHQESDLLAAGVDDVESFLAWLLDSVRD